MWRVAVEDGLASVTELLKSKGHRVVDAKGDLKNVDAVVVTGGNDNFLGDERTRTKTPVIRAEGLSADQIVQELSRHLS